MLGISLKRFCRYRSISTAVKNINPLVECESRRNELSNNKPNEIHVHKYIDSCKTCSEMKPLPIQIGYFKQDKLHVYHFEFSGSKK
jgi:hypothetical protein